MITHGNQARAILRTRSWPLRRFSTRVSTLFQNSLKFQLYSTGNGPNNEPHDIPVPYNESQHELERYGSQFGLSTSFTTLQTYNDTEYRKLWEDEGRPEEVEADDDDLSKEISSLNYKSSQKSKQKLDDLLTNLSIKVDNDAMIVTETERMMKELEGRRSTRRKGREYISRQIPRRITSEIPNFPSESPTAKALNEYLRQITLQNHGYASMRVGGSIDEILKDLVINKLVSLELSISTESLNLIVALFTRLMELDMVAITVTKFERLGICPDVETFNTILRCISALLSSGKLPSTERYRYVIPVIHRMSQYYRVEFDACTFHVLLGLINDSSRRLELVQLMTAQGIDLKGFIQEISEALYLEYGLPENFNGFIERVERVILPDGETFARKEKQQVLGGAIECCLSAGQGIRKVMQVAMANEDLVSSRIASSICGYFISHGELWHSIACANWFAKIKGGKVQNFAEEVLWQSLTKFGVPESRPDVNKLIDLLCYGKNDELKEVIGDLIWKDPLNPDTSFESERFTHAARVCGVRRVS
ncbi:DEKNAAC105381 [Brettanomyces naardenensis]|uniref:DEKNAAC105381 n=1 Tax=Brettanomyces naardenensis TaxID=13370 RepID=A0A448YTA5_BRENA|nr:DEKNAAC105381 [Brettanomyces naardenensis]